jgi:peptidyl-prolyl cis-trans isomerase SurA
MTEKRIRSNFRGLLGAQTAARTTVKSTARTVADTVAKTVFPFVSGTAIPLVAMLAVAAVLTCAAVPAAQAQQPSYPAPGGGFSPASTLDLPPLPTQQAITPNGSVVEDVIARVNDQIITRSEYQRAEQQLLQEGQQQNLSQTDLDDRLHNLLRDMIDQQLLLSKGKELGITGDAETMRELDDIRKKNNLPDLQALQKAAEQQGVSYEDFKEKIRDSAITQQVVRDEVGRRLNLTHAEEVAYYDAHGKDFEVPEQVHLSEILIPTPDDASDAQLAAAQAKADDVAAKLKAGANFAELAKTSSGGPTASAGGDLGDFKRGQLGTVLEDATFSLPTGGTTAPIRTKQGYVILRVDSHQAAGVPPLSAVEPQVEEAIYLQQLQPALRAYLTKAREQAYVEIAPGFVDTGSNRKTSRPADIAYTAYAPPPVKKKVLAKQRVEQERAARDQAQLVAAREKLAEKEAAKAAEHVPAAGAKNASRRVKPKKIRREKIRYGQAPRKSLPAATMQTAETEPTTGVLAGQAPGVAMAPTESVTSITTGTGVDADTTDDALAPRTGPVRKTRISSRESDAEEARAKTKLAKAEVKATDRPVAPTRTETATEKEQDAPLGLNGDTAKKSKKPKHHKGEAKERLQEKPKPTTTEAPVAPTVNPALGEQPIATPSTSPATSTPPNPQTPPQL